MKETFSGFIALIGASNAGKSTLLNGLLGKKISIVSRKAQTTRNKILGIKTVSNKQFIFVDTPGFIRDKGKLTNLIEKTLKNCVEDEIDVVVLVLDAVVALNNISSVEKNVSELKRFGFRDPAVVVLNKVDLIEKPHLLPLIEQLSKLLPGSEMVPISALKKDGLEQLEKTIGNYLPSGPFYYPEDMSSDQEDSFFMGEIVREKIFDQLQDELPYSSAVRVDNIERIKGTVHLDAVILVERDSQKGIVIGSGGKRIKQIGTAARLELEKLIQTPVMLKLNVRVEPNWTQSERGLRRVGYGN